MRIRLFAISVLVLAFLAVQPAFPAHSATTGSAEGAAAQDGKKAASDAKTQFFDGLNALYLAGLGLVGISALFQVVWGGFEYMTAGDSSGRVGSAKKRFTNAAWGIAIAAFSYVVLNTINPDLVRFNLSLDQLQFMKAEDIRKQYEQKYTGGTTPGSAGNPCQEGATPYYWEKNKQCLPYASTVSPNTSKPPNEMCPEPYKPQFPPGTCSLNWLNLGRRGVIK